MDHTEPPTGPLMSGKIVMIDGRRWRCRVGRPGYVVFEAADAAGGDPEPRYDVPVSLVRSVAAEAGALAVRDVAALGRLKDDSGGLIDDRVEVALKHRFGGHGGIGTEWEIRTENEQLKALIRSLPDLWPIQHSTDEHVHYHSHWIHLPQGTSRAEAGTVAAMLADGVWEPVVFGRYLVELQGRLKDRPEWQPLGPDDAVEVPPPSVMENMPKGQLRACFAIRGLGWSWWRERERKLAGIYPPEDSGRVRWNFSDEWFDELPGEEWPEDRFDEDGLSHLYGPNWAGGMPSLFVREEHPDPRVWHNIGCVLDTMIKQGFLPSVQFHEDGTYDVVFRRDGRTRWHHGPDLERCALVAANEALNDVRP